jgi:hypothetical protein
MVLSIRRKTTYNTLFNHRASTIRLLEKRSFASAPNSPWTHTPPMSRTMYYPHPGPATPPCEDSIWPWFIPEDILRILGRMFSLPPCQRQAEERPSHSQTYPTSDTRTDLHVTDSWPSGSLLRTRRGVAAPPLVSLPLCKADGVRPPGTLTEGDHNRNCG